MENKKTKAKSITKPTDKNTRKIPKYYRNLSQDEEIKIRNCINKNMSDEDNERKKNI